MTAADFDRARAMHMLGHAADAKLDTSQTLRVMQVAGLLKIVGRAIGGRGSSVEELGNAVHALQTIIATANPLPPDPDAPLHDAAARIRDRLNLIRDRTCTMYGLDPHADDPFVDLRPPEDLDSALRLIGRVRRELAGANLHIEQLQAELAELKARPTERKLAAVPDAPPRPLTTQAPRPANCEPTPSPWNGYASDSNYDPYAVDRWSVPRGY